MNRWYAVLLLMIGISCGSKRNVPDVSGVKAPMSLQRFEQSFFAIDTTKIEESLLELTAEYHGFAQDFLFNILGSSTASVAKDMPVFIRTYQSMAKEVSVQFGDLTKEVNEVQQGLQFVKHYFPDYRIPEKLITFIGPLNSYGSIITPDGLGVGLQLYLGSEHPLYLAKKDNNCTHVIFPEGSIESIYLLMPLKM